MLKRIKVCVFITLICFFQACRFIENKNTHDNTDKIIVKIKPGMSSHKIAELLKDKKLINHPKLFLLFVKLKNAEKMLKPGIFEFSLNSSYNEIIKNLIDGKEVLIKVTIPEGWSSFEIAERLESRELGSKQKYLELIEHQKLEGYLFPDTYYFSSVLSEQQILDEMKQNFFKNVDPIIEEAKLKNLMINSVYDTIILASIVEEEAMLNRERPLIASVFQNRLARHYPLQSCATVIYAFKKDFGVKKYRLLYKDLNIDSVYNTYRRKGLPPTPICSPGLNSIKAVIYQKPTNFMFFLRSKANNGSHVFSNKYAEHVEAKKTNIG